MSSDSIQVFSKIPVNKFNGNIKRKKINNRIRKIRMKRVLDKIMTRRNGLCVKRRKLKNQRSIVNAKMKPMKIKKENNRKKRFGIKLEKSGIASSTSNDDVIVIDDDEVLDTGLPRKRCKNKNIQTLARKQKIKRLRKIRANRARCKINEDSNRKCVVKTTLTNRKRCNLINKKINRTKKCLRVCKSRNRKIVPVMSYDKVIEVIISDDDESEIVDISEESLSFAHITIDGQGVGLSCGKGKFTFSGIITCIKYFEERGHNDIVVLLSTKYQHRSCEQYPGIRDLQQKGRLKFIPRRIINGKPVDIFDDEGVLLEYAKLAGGLFVSNKEFKNFLTEAAYKEIIMERTLKFNFYGDMITFPLRPNGRAGPTLQRMLNGQYDPL